MAYKNVLSMRTNKSVPPNLSRNSSTVAMQASLEQVPQKSFSLKKQAVQKQNMQELVQQVTRNSSTLKVQAVQERVQQLPMNSSIVAAQVAKKQMQQVPRDASMVEAAGVQVQAQKETLNSGENEQSEQQVPLTQKLKRGNTIMDHVHARQERKLILLNKKNQPIGPTNAVVAELSSFLGTLERNVMLCPLNIHNWKYMDTKRDLWEYTQEKYIIPDAAEKWTLKTIQNARGKYKNELYQKHYKPFDNDDLRMAKKPADVSEPDFKDLLKYWNSEEFKKMSETNTKNRKKLKNPHTAGKTSFAVIRNKLEKEKENPDDVSSKEMFAVTRARKPNRVHKDSDEDTISKIAEMEKLQSQQNEDGSESIDAFETVMGPGHPGYLRLYGRGVTKKSLKGKGHSEPSLSATDDEMLQNKLEKLEERMVQKLEQQKTTIRQEVTFDIVGRLKSMYPGLQLDVDMFETFSTQSQQEDIQPINRPSSSSNNQGGDDNQGDDDRI